MREDGGRPSLRATTGRRLLDRATSVPDRPASPAGRPVTAWSRSAVPPRRLRVDHELRCSATVNPAGSCCGLGGPCGAGRWLGCPGAVGDGDPAATALLATGWRPPWVQGPVGALVAGASSGVLSVLAAASGPPAASFAAARGREPAVTTATLQAFALPLTLFTLAAVGLPSVAANPLVRAAAGLVLGLRWPCHRPGGSTVSRCAGSPSSSPPPGERSWSSAPGGGPPEGSGCVRPHQQPVGTPLLPAMHGPSLVASAGSSGLRSVRAQRHPCRADHRPVRAGA